MSERYTERAHAAKMKRNVLPEASIDFRIHPEDHSEIPEDVYTLFFALQAECEKAGAMDYHVYASRLWQEAFGDIAIEHSAFRQFEANLIRGLQGIAMSDLVYDDVKGPEKIKELIRALYDKAATVVLWSQGDVGNSGYQDAKIASSRTVHNFARAMRDEGHLSDVKERTAYLVGGNKLNLLRNYLESKKAKGVDSIKLAVVEDSRKNIDAVAALVKEIFGDAGSVIPIWATYSREGQREHTENAEIFAKEKAKYNGIDSFGELRSGNWPERLQGAELIVDFDGVIVDNIRVRNAAAQVKWQSILEAAGTMGIPEDTLFKKSS